VFESRSLAPELDALALVGDKPDRGSGKEAAELDRDTLKLPIFEPHAWIRRGQNLVEGLSLKLLRCGSAALARESCSDDAEHLS